ncbi:MAG TPA: hypothetical protein VF534_21985 [Paraburkholderia sp.]
MQTVAWKRYQENLQDRCERIEYVRWQTRDVKQHTIASRRIMLHRDGLAVVP